MNDRNDRNRDRQFGPQRGQHERSGWGREREDDDRSGAGPQQQWSSAEDETYGSEWRGDQSTGHGQAGGARHGGAGHSQHGGGSGYYSRGNAGMYGGGSGGGYTGGRGGSGYGGSSGTDYGRGNYGGYSGDQARFGGNQGGYGGTQGGSYGAGNTGAHAGSSGQQSFAGGYAYGERPASGGVGSPQAARAGGGFAGRGPKGYTRADERIREDVCDRLSLDDHVDASEIEVRVQNGEVTLEGTVLARSMKHQAEDLAEAVPGVTDVHNHLRVMKGVLNELKDKITGKDDERHYANSGTKDTPAHGSGAGAAGRNGVL